MDEETLLEILDVYTEMIEKQDEIIVRMGRIISRQAEAIQLIKNDREFSDPQLEKDMAIVDEVKRDYESYIKP